MQDTNTRFELAIECGNLEVAVETAESIDRPDCWERLAQQALKQGNHKVTNLLMIYISPTEKFLVDCGEGVSENEEF